MAREHARGAWSQGGRASVRAGRRECKSGLSGNGQPGGWNLRVYEWSLGARSGPESFLILSRSLPGAPWQPQGSQGRSKGLPGNPREPPGPPVEAPVACISSNEAHWNDVGAALERPGGTRSDPEGVFGAPWDALRKPRELPGTHQKLTGSSRRTLREPQEPPGASQGPPEAPPGTPRDLLWKLRWRHGRFEKR